MVDFIEQKTLELERKVGEANRLIDLEYYLNDFKKVEIFKNYNIPSKYNRQLKELPEQELVSDDLFTSKLGFHEEAFVSKIYSKLPTVKPARLYQPVTKRTSVSSSIRAREEVILSLTERILAYIQVNHGPATVKGEPFGQYPITPDGFNISRVTIRSEDGIVESTIEYVPKQSLFGSNMVTARLNFNSQDEADRQAYFDLCKILEGLNSHKTILGRISRLYRAITGKRKEYGFLGSSRKIKDSETPKAAI